MPDRSRTRPRPDQPGCSHQQRGEEQHREQPETKPPVVVEGPMAYHSRGAICRRVRRRRDEGNGCHDRQDQQARRNPAEPSERLMDQQDQDRGDSQGGPRYAYGGRAIHRRQLRRRRRPLLCPRCRSRGSTSRGGEPSCTSPTRDRSRQLPTIRGREGLGIVADAAKRLLARRSDSSNCA